MIQLILYVIVAAIVGMVSGALGGAVIGAISGGIAIARGADVNAAMGIGVGDGVRVAYIVGFISGAAAGGMTWASSRNLLRLTYTAMVAGGVTGPIASVGAVLGSVTWPLLGICIAATLATLFGLSRLKIMGSLEARSRARPEVRKTEQISVTVKIKRWVHDVILTFPIGISIGAVGGGSLGSLFAVVLVIAIGRPVGDFAIGGLAGASMGAIVGTVAVATARFVGHRGGMKRVALEHGSAFGASVSIAAVLGEYADLATGAMMGTVVGFLYGLLRLTSTVRGGKLARGSHPRAKKHG